MFIDNLLYIVCVENYVFENEIRNTHASNFWKCEQNIGIRLIYTKRIVLSISRRPVSL
jgi:hypothetical protein